MKLYKTVTDSDLQIRGEPSHPDPEIKGGGAVSKKKNCFSPLGLSLVYQLGVGGGRGGLGGSGPSPGSITAKVTVKIEIVQKVKHSKKYICL